MRNQILFVRAIKLAARATWLGLKAAGFVLPFLLVYIAAYAAFALFIRPVGSDVHAILAGIVLVGAIFSFFSERVAPRCQ